MSSTNKTPNYNLPQFVVGDKPSWLTDENAAMLAIDGAMHANSQSAASAAALAETAKTAADNALSVAGGAVDMGNDNSEKLNGIRLIKEYFPISGGGSAIIMKRLALPNEDAFTLLRADILPSSPLVGERWKYIGKTANRKVFDFLPVVAPEVGVPFSVHVVGTGVLQNTQVDLATYYNGTDSFWLIHWNAFNNDYSVSPVGRFNSPLTNVDALTVTLTAIPE